MTCQSELAKRTQSKVSQTKPLAQLARESISSPKRKGSDSVYKENDAAPLANVAKRNVNYSKYKYQILNFERSASQKTIIAVE